MKITVKEYTEKEIEIKLPCYRKRTFDTGQILRVVLITKNKSISVTSDEISTSSLGEYYFSNEYQDATKEEFETQFNKTMKYLIDLK